MHGGLRDPVGNGNDFVSVTDFQIERYPAMTFANSDDAMARIRGKTLEQRVNTSRHAGGLLMKGKAVDRVNYVTNDCKFSGQSAHEYRLCGVSMKDVVVD